MIANANGNHATHTAPCDLTAMKRSEFSLINALHAAASEVEQIGRGSLEAAPARLQAAAEAARARIAEAMIALAGTVNGLTAAMNGAAEAIFEDLSTQPFVPPEVWDSAADTTAEQPAEAAAGADSSAPAHEPGTVNGTNGKAYPASTPTASQERRSPGEPACCPAAASTPHGPLCSCRGRQGEHGCDVTREDPQAGQEDGHGEVVLVAAVAANPPVDDPARPGDNKPRGNKHRKRSPVR